MPTGAGRMLLIFYFLLVTFSPQQPWKVVAIRYSTGDTAAFIGHRPDLRPAIVFADYKRPIPSCPDPLHNR
ncbi:hypothetical protein HPP92_019711 [Vanilla planifolia]|uniref:Uncharacterized protein n=1 Tax=Vanilla planifolia TaxID=51239 RepID=A0A835Q0Q6_VANPL|nr:hypothetical protein HPP92_020145 [Vanilla planifolia]KAG0465547.1 hypothetical protein HPP92_019711 [Vanilla planifolia]